MFCWNALGVPRNQLSVLLEDGDISSFIAGTFDPLAGLATFKVSVITSRVVHMADVDSSIAFARSGHTTISW